MSWVLLGALAVALGAVVVSLTRSGKKTSGAAPQQDLSGLGVLEARVGDAISVAGASESYEDLNFTVDRKHRYQKGRSQWFELSGLAAGQRIFLEAEEDDGIKTKLNRGGDKLRISAFGLTEDDLARMDDKEDASEGFEYDGSRWTYEESGEVMFFEDNAGRGEGFYAWEFREENGKRVLFIEKWEAEPFEAGIAESIPSSDVHVYRR